MGLFSKSITTVGTSVSRVIEDPQLPDSIRSGFVNSAWNDDGQIIENIMETLAGSVGMRASRMYEFGKDTYLYGVPSSHLKSSADAQPQVKTVIETLNGGAVTIDYYHFGAPNLTHIGWYTLVQNFGYNTTTNEIATLTAAKGGNKVYLKSFTPVVREATLAELENGSLDQWGRATNWGVTPQRQLSAAGVPNQLQTPFKVDPSVGADYIQVIYVWEEPYNVVVDGATVTRKNLFESSFTIQVSAYDPIADWHQVAYTRNGVLKYFMYRNGAGTYPAVDNVYSTQHDPLGSFFPFTYFRYNKVAQNLDKNSNAYKHSKKMCKFLQLDYDEVSDGINANPDIADVEQAMLVMAVPANTTNAMEQRYLYDFFGAIHDSTQSSMSNPNNMDSNTLLQQLIKNQLQSPAVQGNIIIQDKRFKMSLGYSSISKTKKAGVLGPVGSYHGGYTTATISKDGEYVTNGTAVRWSSQQPAHYYQLQISETTYEEVRVLDLKMTYHIFNEYSAVADETDKILLIPLDMDIVGQYSIPDREVIYSRSLHYVFNSRVVTKLKWYATPAFRVILLIVAIIITIVSWGSGSSSIGAVLGLTGAAALIVTIIVNLIIGKLIGMALKALVRVFGAKIAILAAIIAMIYGAGSMIDAGSVAGAPWAMEMMQLANGLIAEAMQDKFNDLLAEQDAFNLFVKTKEELLDTANKLLETTNFLSPAIIFGEKPQQFYDRTVHSGNIGTLTVDAISSYADIALTLPTISQTLGDS
jgi:hypothetical protein